MRSRKRSQTGGRTHSVIRNGRARVVGNAIKPGTGYRWDRVKDPNSGTKTSQTGIPWNFIGCCLWLEQQWKSTTYSEKLTKRLRVIDYKFAQILLLSCWQIHLPKGERKNQGLLSWTSSSPTKKLIEEWGRKSDPVLFESERSTEGGPEKGQPTPQTQQKCDELWGKTGGIQGSNGVKSWGRTMSRKDRKFYHTEDSITTTTPPREKLEDSLKCWKGKRIYSGNGRRSTGGPGANRRRGHFWATLICTK